MNNFDVELIKKYVDENKIDSALDKLKSGYPVQYIIGNVDFLNVSIDVNENVLIPRFETEYLVDDLIKLINKYDFINPNILDIGTGSGCISIALAKNIKCSCTGIDINNKAILLAKKNAIKNNVLVKFVKESAESFNSEKKFDVLVSNPPYVKRGSLVDEKIKYEPENAIYADEDGLYFYKIILNKCKNLLNKKNIIAFEIGDGEGNEIIKLIKIVFPNSKVIFKKDFNNYDRYIYVINE